MLKPICPSTNVFAVGINSTDAYLRVKFGQTDFFKLELLSFDLKSIK